MDEHKNTSGIIAPANVIEYRAWDELTGRMSDILKIKMRMCIEFPEVERFANLSVEYIRLDEERKALIS